MKKLVSILIFIVVLQTVKAQQRAQFSQYMVNNYVLNPALGGTEDFVDVKAGFRSQWLGFEGAPVTYYLSAHTPIGREHGTGHGHHRGEHKGWHGVGAYLYNDITGPTSRSGGLASYSYNMPINKFIRMSLGVFGGFQQFKIDGNSFLLLDQDDAVLNGVRTTFVPDAMIGTWVYAKYWYVGLAAHQILQNKLDFEDVGSINHNGTDISKLNNHYFVNGGLNVPVGYDFSVVPSFMVKVVTPAPVSVDLNCKMSYKKGLYWGGISYRSLDSFALLAGTTIRYKIGISYSYDLTTSELRKYNTGSHEIVISYKIPPHGSPDCPSKFWH